MKIRIDKVQWNGSTCALETSTHTVQWEVESVQIEQTVSPSSMFTCSFTERSAQWPFFDERLDGNCQNRPHINYSYISIQLVNAKQFPTRGIIYNVTIFPPSFPLPKRQDITPLMFSLLFCFYSHDVCPSLCDCKQGVSLSASSGEQPTTGFLLWTPLSFLFFCWSWKNNNNQIRGCSPLLLCLNCIWVLFWCPASGLLQKLSPHSWSVENDDVFWATRKAANDRRQLMVTLHIKASVWIQKWGDVTTQFVHTHCWSISSVSFVKT